MSNPNPSPATRFAPGNPGRQKGARARLGEKFLESVRADFEANGDAVIRTVREQDPSTYFATIAKLLPREVEARLAVEHTSHALAPDDYRELSELLTFVRSLGAEGSPAEVRARVESALRLEFAKPLPQLEVLVPECPVPPGPSEE
jgi:hypothetical protein